VAVELAVAVALALPLALAPEKGARGSGAPSPHPAPTLPLPAPGGLGRHCCFLILLPGPVSQLQGHSSLKPSILGARSFGCYRNETMLHGMRQEGRVGRCRPVLGCVCRLGGQYTSELRLGMAGKA